MARNILRQAVLEILETHSLQLDFLVWAYTSTVAHATDVVIRRPLRAAPDRPAAGASSKLSTPQANLAYPRGVKLKLA